ncbi:hypothetical protein COL26b_014309 [Colletotrichum chrysophilum]|uniref:uncharacterized protein n=1 Tax=Colletotrichum chrysophilum TaxID=1836956 RepID=UPI002300CFE3|nr:uncharacterized protein COL26b_014309 [Colletotrichum chrysophilum]KAJ0359607.1 hypothetical protein COL26b_014309 [Colletotrichum chrysophilum]
MAHGASPVATRESYIGYKKDTQGFVEWMIKTTSLILKTQPRSGENAQLPTGVSSSGATTVAGLVSMARLIADSGAAVSGSTFRRLISIIRARRNHYHAFVEHASTWSDTDIEKSNDMHRHFIDSLIDIFSILGGVSWWEKQMEANEMTSKRPDSDAEQIEEMKGIIFSNKFASLDLSHGDSKPEPPSEPESDADEPVAESKTAKKKRVNGKKGKGKTSKLGKSRKPARKADSSADASVESYRILEDDQLLSYTMAILSFRTEWAQIRQYVQDLWIDVIHKNLNTAVAGAVSNVAIAKIKKTELELFDDFPEHCYFEKITDTLTRGGLHRLQKVAEEKAAADRDHHGCLVDVKEQLLMYTYQDLLDFCTDFQKSRNGKPTKAMRAKIGLWDPKLSLETTTKEERILWRRKFTINWLYDLVNEYSSWEQTQRGERCFSDDVDWSPSGPSSSRRTLLGLTDFAAFVTSLASQKTGSDLSLKISPWQVFQLQCIVDATCVKSGWSLCSHGGHILEAPAAGFLAIRDIKSIFDERAEDEAGHDHTLAAVRLSREPTYFDLFTGEQSEPTELVRHMYEKVGWDDDWSGHQMSVGEGLFRTFLTMDLLKPAKANVEQSAVKKDLSRAVYSKLETILEDLEIAKLDLWNDISGLRCRSGMDFASLNIALTIIMDEVEDALYHAKNPTFERIYLPPGKGPDPPITSKVFRLIREAMAGRDKDILKVFADKFESMWETTPAYLLWSGDACLQIPIERTFDKLGIRMPEELRGDVCSVM